MTPWKDCPTCEGSGKVIWWEGDGYDGPCWIAAPEPEKELPHNKQCPLCAAHEAECQRREQDARQAGMVEGFADGRRIERESWEKALNEMINRAKAHNSHLIAPTFSIEVNGRVTKERAPTPEESDKGIKRVIEDIELESIDVVSTPAPVKSCWNCGHNLETDLGCVHCCEDHINWTPKDGVK